MKKETVREGEKDRIAKSQKDRQKHRRTKNRKKETQKHRNTDG
jgi:hypothetical protein